MIAKLPPASWLGSKHGKLTIPCCTQANVLKFRTVLVIFMVQYEQVVLLQAIGLYQL